MKSLPFSALGATLRRVSNRRLYRGLIYAQQTYLNKSLVNAHKVAFVAARYPHGSSAKRRPESQLKILV